MYVFYTDYKNANLDQVFENLRSTGHVPTKAEPFCNSEKEIIEQAQGANVLVGSLASFSRSVLSSLSDLRMVCAPQVGTDHIDIIAAKKLGIWVANSPLHNITEVACHSLTLALMSLRKIAIMDEHVRSGGWEYNVAGELRRPRGLTVGIVGVGNIGRTFADHAEPCFGRVLGYDPYICDDSWPENIIKITNLEDMLCQCDVISMHVPLTDETRNMADAKFFQAMRQNAHFINASRGPVADTNALLEALDSGHLEGAGLDVLPQEPPAPDDPILRHPRVILTPHSAFYSCESQSEKHKVTLENIVAFGKNGRPVHCVVEGR